MEGRDFMTASFKTVDAIYKVISEHVTDEQMNQIIKALHQVKGNHSFEETVARLIATHKDAKFRKSKA